MNLLASILFCSFYLCISGSMISQSLRRVKCTSLNIANSRIIQKRSTRLFSTVNDNDSKTDKATTPIFSFGVIADIQYVDSEDAMNFQGSTMRRYRQSFNTFKEAISSWSALEQAPKCAIVLGDVLDGKSATMKNQEKCITDVLDASKDINYEMLYCFGNHCHYSFSRKDLYEKLIPPFLKSDERKEKKNEENKTRSSLGGNCSPEKLYYDWSPCQDWRFISLDCYDISLIGSSSIENKKIAEDLLAKNNPNDLNIGGNWFNGLTYNMRRWVPYNGGISKEQIAWLDNVLKTSYELNEKVVIFCHQPVYAINKPQSVVWNSEVVLEIIRKYGNVVIWIAGHDHSGQVNNHC